MAITERRNLFTLLGRGRGGLHCIDFPKHTVCGPLLYRILSHWKKRYKRCAKLQFRPSLHQFSQNSKLLRPAIPISTNISHDIWKVWVLRQRPYVKYDCHWTHFHDLIIAWQVFVKRSHTLFHGNPTRQSGLVDDNCHRQTNRRTCSLDKAFLFYFIKRI